LGITTIAIRKTGGLLYPYKGWITAVFLLLAYPFLPVTPKGVGTAVAHLILGRVLNKVTSVHIVRNRIYFGVPFLNLGPLLLT
jgi:hypothetical protein